MSPSPVTFLIAVRNGERFLKPALDSVFQQTFEAFSVVVVDDASTDQSSNILGSYKDPRLRVFRNEKGIGQAASLNRGLGEIRSPYVARTDADDVCNPERLARQHAFLEKNPRMAVVGSACDVIDGNSRRHMTLHRPNSPGFLKWYLCFQNPLAHPSVMIRRSAIDEAGGYATDTPNTEDYDLWARMGLRHEMTNLSESLMSVRQHRGSLSATHTDVQRQVRSRIQSDWIRRIPNNGLTDAEIIAWSHDKLNPAGRAGVIWKLYRAHAGNMSLTKGELRQIRKDAAARLMMIAPHIPRLDEGFRQFRRALSIHPVVPAAPLAWLWQRYITRQVHNPICAFQSVVLPPENAASDL